MIEDFNAGGRALWAAVTEAHELDAVQCVQLVEACRIKDRCDWLDLLLREKPDDLALLTKANDSANQMKQLLAALRLPDAAGKRPQYRGPRGAQAPTVPGGKVSSIDRARARKGA